MRIPTILILSLLLPVYGCSDDHDDHAHHTDHADHADHDGDDMHGDDHHGEPHPLGKLTAHGVTFEVVQLGHIEAGHEGSAELVFASGKERISTVRAWIGVESGEGSMKGSWGLEDENRMHGHIEVPDPIPAGSKLWIELDKDDKTETVSIAFHE